MIIPIALLPHKGQGTPQHPIFAASETPYIGGAGHGRVPWARLEISAVPAWSAGSRREGWRPAIVRPVRTAAGCLGGGVSEELLEMVAGDEPASADFDVGQVAAAHLVALPDRIH